MTDARKVCQSSAAPSAPAAEPPQDVAGLIGRLREFREYLDADELHSNHVWQDAHKSLFREAAAALAAMARERDGYKRAIAINVQYAETQDGAIRYHKKRAEQAECDLAAARERIKELEQETEKRHRLLCLHHADAMELWAALKDLSFECDGVIGHCNSPSVDTYNRTFAVLKRHEQGYSEQMRSSANFQQNSTIDAARAGKGEG